MNEKSARKTLAELKAGAHARDPEAFDAAYEQVSRAVELGEQIYELRTRAGLTQTELARRMGTSQPAIARLEAGGISPTLETLKRVAEAVGVQLVIGFVGADESIEEPPSEAPTRRLVVLGRSTA